MGIEWNVMNGMSETLFEQKKQKRVLPNWMLEVKRSEPKDTEKNNSEDAEKNNSMNVNLKLKKKIKTITKGVKNANLKKIKVIVKGVKNANLSDKFDSIQGVKNANLIDSDKSNLWMGQTSLSKKCHTQTNHQAFQRKMASLNDDMP